MCAAAHAWVGLGRIVYVSSSEQLTAWLAEHDLPLLDLRAGRQRLEDVFLRLTAITGEQPIVRQDNSE